MYNPNLSVKIAGLRVAVKDYNAMALVAKHLENVVAHVTSQISSKKQSFETSYPLYMDSYLSCLVDKGKVELGVYHINEKSIYSRIDDKDISVKTFEIATSRLIAQIDTNSRIIESGEHVPQDKELLKQWYILHKKKEINFEH